MGDYGTVCGARAWTAFQECVASSAAPVFDGVDDGGEVVVGQDHVGCFLADVGADHGMAALGNLAVDLRTQRKVGVDAQPAVVWSAVHRVEDYRSWWPWLREFDGRVLAPGERWRCTIRPPLPWSLRVEIHLVDVRDGRVHAVVSGDVTGAASVSIAHGPEGGTLICLDAALDAGGGATAILHRVAPRTSRWAHDRVIDAALEGFCRRAI